MIAQYEWMRLTHTGKAFSLMMIVWSWSNGKWFKRDFWKPIWTWKSTSKRNWRRFPIQKPQIWKHWCNWFKKGASKKVKVTHSDNSTLWSPFYFEHVVDTLFSDSPSPTPPLPKTKYIEEILVFMHKYIERIVNIEGEGNCGCWANSTLIGKREENHTLVCQQLIKELNHIKNHTQCYTGKMFWCNSWISYYLY